MQRLGALGMKARSKLATPRRAQWRVAADLAVVALDLDVVERMRREHRDVVFVWQPASVGQFEVMKHYTIIGQLLAELSDRFCFAVVLGIADSMNDGHGDYLGM